MILRRWRAWRELVRLRREAERQASVAFWEKFWDGVPEDRVWGVAVLAAAWFGTDEQAGYAVQRYLAVRDQKANTCAPEGEA